MVFSMTKSTTQEGGNIGCGLPVWVFPQLLSQNPPNCRWGEFCPLGDVSHRSSWALLEESLDFRDVFMHDSSFRPSPSTFPSKRQISFKLSYLPLNCFQMYFPCLVSVFLLQCSPSNSAAAAIGIKKFHHVHSHFVRNRHFRASSSEGCKNTEKSICQINSRYKTNWRTS